MTEVKPADVMTLMFYVASETELIILQSKLQSTQKVKQTKAHRVISLACLLFSLDLFKVKLKYFYISVNYFPVLSVLVQCVKPTDRHTSCGVSAVISDTNSPQNVPLNHHGNKLFFSEQAVAPWWSRDQLCGSD